MRIVAAWLILLSVLAAPASTADAAAPPAAEEVKEAVAPPEEKAGSAEAEPDGAAPTAASITEPGAGESAAKGVDPVRLGATEKALRASFGEALRPAPLEVKKHPGYAFMEEKMRARQLPGEGEEAEPVPALNPYEGQQRLVRKLSGGDVAEVEYDLFAGKVYNIRWKLADRFERTIVEDYVEAATKRYGKPDYDQFVEARFGSGKTDVSRSGWSRDGRIIEVRQLDPKSGGPVYVTVGDRKAYDAIVAARGVIAPSPQSMGPWWERPAKQYEPMSKKEREALLAAFGAVLDQTAF
ncbi:MAG: hypothetical protein Q8R92_01860 [Deltaproteobacteria bacterium]|nr:hypothetical protein [Deltaproteobacteria bacterium]